MRAEQVLGRRLLGGLLALVGAEVRAHARSVHVDRAGLLGREVLAARLELQVPVALPVDVHRDVFVGENVDITLHPEVKVKVSVNVARTAAEAETQQKTGKAVIADSRSNARETANDDAKAAFLDDSALANEAEAAQVEAADDAAAAEKAAKKSAKKASKKSDDVSGEGEEAAE